LTLNSRAIPQFNVAKDDEKVSGFHSLSLADIHIDHAAFTDDTSIQCLKGTPGSPRNAGACAVRRSGIRESVLGHHNVPGNLAGSLHRSGKRTLGWKSGKIDLIVRNQQVSQFHGFTALRDAAKRVVRLTDDDLNLSNLQVVRTQIRGSLPV